MGTDSTTTTTSDDGSTSTGSATGASQRESLAGNLVALARGGSAGDSRLLARVVRSTTYLRRTGGFQPAVLDSLVQQAFDADSSTLALLLRVIPKIVESPSAPSSSSSSSSSSSTASQSSAVPASDDNATASAETTNEDSAAENSGSAGLRILATCDSVVRQHIQMYLLLVVVIGLIDSKEAEAAVPVALLLAELVQLHGNRRLSPLVSKAFFYFSRVFELAGRFGDIHETLLKAHRTAGLRHDEETQLTVLNVLLRQHLQSKQYDQAHHLLSNTKFNESGVSANQGARYLYYKARVLAIQLDYREADQLLSSAMAKAPQTGALGFRVTVQKWACLVQLLLGQIPEKRIFRRPAFSTALKPYRQLTLAVHFGDLTYFQQVITDHRQTFERDDTLALISRLRVSVIKAGLRKIGLAYTRISLAHIQQKLHLDSLEGAEFAVAKAIRDGVVDGAINAEQGYLITNAHADVYSTPEPMDAFHSRIQTCIELHNSAVQGMRFPPEILKASIRTRAGSDEEDIDPESLLDEDLDDDL